MHAEAALQFARSPGVLGLHAALGAPAAAAGHVAGQGGTTQGYGPQALVQPSPKAILSQEDE